MPGTAFNAANWTGYDSQSFTATASHTDFTLLIDISTFSATWKSNVQSDGADIRITKSDGTTELAYDLINWAYNAGAPTGHIRVLFAGATGTGANTIRVWAGYTGGTATAYADSETYGADNAYNSGWLQYLPLDGDANDRTSNANNGTLNSLAFGTDDITGQVGTALNLDGSGGGNPPAGGPPYSGDYIQAAAATSSLAGGLSTYTAMAWVKATSQAQTDEDTILSDWQGSSNRAILLRYDSNSNQIDLLLQRTDNTYDIDSNNATIEGAWHHVAVTFDGTTGTMYLDGSALTNTVSLSGTLDVADYAQLWGASPHTAADGWLGGLDELQQHGATRSAAWIADEYAQSNDNATWWGSWSWTAVGGGDPEVGLVGGKLVGGGILMRGRLVA